MCVCIVGSLFSWIWLHTREETAERDDGEPGDDSTEDSGVLGRGRRQISSTGRTGGSPVYQRSAAPNTMVDVDGVVQHGLFEA